MLEINLPPYDIKLYRKNDRTVIYDFLRRRNVVLTPEEWVRQHFTHYLVEQKGYPSALMMNEVTLDINGMRKRCDTVLYDRTAARPRMIMEYKAPDVPVTQAVFDQISSYNSVLRVDYLIVSNGLTHYACKVAQDGLTYEFLTAIPDYGDL